MSKKSRRRDYRMRRGVKRKSRFSIRSVLLISTILWVSIVSLYSLYALANQSSTHIAAGSNSSSSVSRVNEFLLPRIIDISSASQIDLLNHLPGYSLLFFEERDCPGCRELSPAVDRFFSSSSNLSIRLVRIHLDDIYMSNPGAALDLVKRYQVPGTPTLILVRDGVEIARHVGVFVGDQYTGLVEFIESSLEKSSSNSGGVGSVSSSILGPLSSLVLGFLAALSPCSLPMIILFASSTRSSGFSRTLVLFASLVLILVPVSLGISSLNNLTKTLNISLYYVLVTYVSTVSLVWGFLTLLDREPLVSVRGGSSVILPILGMQCSFPFLLAVLSILPRDPLTAVASSVLFSIGYTAPYAGSSLLLGSLRGISTSSGWGRFFRILQGVILVSTGIYVLATSVPNILY